MLNFFKIKKLTNRILLACILVWPSIIFSQNIRFEHVTGDNGLPRNSITCVEQDNTGFIWMGSFNGLIKFDGYNYKLFTHQYADSLGLPGHLVGQIICADNGLIYLSISNNGFSVLDPRTEKFENFYLEDSLTLDRDNVNNMQMDNLGNLWVATDNGLLYFNTKTKEITNHHFKNPLIAYDSTNNYHNYISAIALDSLNNIYILGYKGTLSYYNIYNKTYQPLSYCNKAQESIFLYNSGHLHIIKNQLWVSTENDGIYIHDLKKKSTIKHLFPKTIVSDIKEINNQIWIATDGQGVYILNEKNKIINHLVNNPYDPFTISSNATYCINQSRDYTIWVGCYSSGINLYNKSRHKFNSISEIGPKGNRLSNRAIINLKNKNDSTLLIGTDGGGLNQMNLKTGYTQLTKSNNGILDKKVVKTISVYDENTIYIGTYGQGLYKCKFVSSNKVIASQIERKFSGKFKHVWYIHKISDTALFLGYLHSGLSIFNPIKNTFIDLNNFDGHNIQCITQIDDRLWISSEQKGLTICDERGQILKKYTTINNDSTSLPSNFVLDIFEDSKHQIWIGTNSTGLSVMKDPENGKFTNINREFNFPAKMVTNIEEDNNGFLWISTNKGLVRFNTNTYESELFDNKDGLQGKKFNANSSFNFKNKTLYFGGVDGLSYFQPKQIQRNDVLPEIAITRLLVDNKLVEINQKINNRVILKQPIAYTKGIILSHKEQNFTIEFSALHYESSSKNQYQYMLEGFDEDWIKTKPGQPYAKYTNLKKGDFIFKIRAANADNNWSNKALEFPIKITPPFYLTNWFYFMVIFIAISFIIIYIRLRTKKLSRDKKKLEKLVNKRTKELEDKAQMVSNQNEKISHINKQLSEYNKTRDKIFSIIAHDLKTPLNAIISFSCLLDDESEEYSKEELKRFNRIIHQTSVQMNNLILNLLHWANSQIGKIRVDAREIEIAEVFEELEQLNEAYAIDKNIHLSFEDNSTKVFADYEMLVVILRNLISNSLKFTNKGGSIKVTSEIVNNRTSISVSDNGIGMDNNQIKTILESQTPISKRGTENEAGTGLGLFLCKDFTQKNNGELIINSNLPKGTIVTAIFPATAPKNNC